MSIAYYLRAQPETRDEDRLHLYLYEVRSFETTSPSAPATIEARGLEFDAAQALIREREAAA